MFNDNINVAIDNSRTISKVKSPVLPPPVKGLSPICGYVLSRNEALPLVP